MSRLALLVIAPLRCTEPPRADAPPPSGPAPSSAAPATSAAAASSAAPAASPAASAGPAPAALDPGPPGKVVATGAPVEVRARVVLAAAPADPEPASEIGSPVRIRYEVANTGRTPLVLWHAGFWPNHRVVVTGPGGGTPALLPLGRTGAAAFSPRGPRDKNVEWKVDPGSIDASDGALDLAEVCDLSTPGSYTVRIDYEEDLAFSSNTLRFWRVRAGALDPLRKLAGWDREEVDVFERPTAHPGRAQTGETQGFITSQKEALRRLGVEVAWEAATGRYRVVSAR